MIRFPEWVCKEMNFRVCVSKQIVQKQAIPIVQRCVTDSRKRDKHIRRLDLTP